VEIIDLGVCPFVVTGPVSANRAGEWAQSELIERLLLNQPCQPILEVVPSLAICPASREEAKPECE
jgi:hypothetical protein